MADRWMSHAPRLLVWLGIVCLAGLGAVLVAQHVFDMQPCPWCVLQRLIFVAISLAALIGLAGQWTRLLVVRRLGAALMGLLALGGIAAALAWALKHRGHLYRAHLTARLAAIPVLLLALSGLVAATYQHEVASQSESCAMTAADRLLTALDLEAKWPAVFMVTASCQDAAHYRLLGLPYEIWSGLLFALALGAGLVALLRGARV